MKPTIKPKRTAEQRAEEEAIRGQHAANPIRQRPAGAINRQSLTAILSLVARLKALRESQGRTLAEVAERMGWAMEEIGGDGFLISTPFQRVGRRFINEVCEGLVPALQRRSLVREAYTQPTLLQTLREF